MRFGFGCRRWVHLLVWRLIPNIKHTPATQPAAEEPLGQISCNLIEYSVRSETPEAAPDRCKWACIFMGRYSWYMHIVPLKKKSDAVLVLQDFIAEHSKPHGILCDYGTEFQGVFKDYCTTHGIRCRHSTPYSTFMQGFIERHNREVKNLARSLSSTAAYLQHFGCMCLGQWCTSRIKFELRRGRRPRAPPLPSYSHCGL